MLSGSVTLGSRTILGAGVSVESNVSIGSDVYIAPGHGVSNHIESNSRLIKDLIMFSPWPSFTEEEAEAVQSVVLSNKVNYWTGSECHELEKEFADFSETKYAIVLANGTVALDVAFKALGIVAGDEVIVTSRTFLASVSSIVNSGAKPVFADVDPDSQNISINSIRAVLTGKTKAIVCVHLAGWPCEMDPIFQLANESILRGSVGCMNHLEQMHVDAGDAGRDWKDSA